MDKKVWLSLFSVENVLSHGTEAFRRRTLLRFRKFLVSKKVADKRGLSQLCVDLSLSRGTAIFGRGFFQCLRKSLVSNNLEDKTWMESDNIPTRCVFSAYRRKIEGNPFGVSEKFRYR